VSQILSLLVYVMSSINLSLKSWLISSKKCCQELFHLHKVFLFPVDSSLIMGMKLDRLGFDDRWIHLVMVCVRTVSYSVVVNGNPVGSIQPSMRIRQGDPISPYLFLICTEALSFVITHAVDLGVITGVPTSPRGPRLSHLYFADDNLLFCKANSVERICLMRILRVYEARSRQQLNLQKTTIFFSCNTSAAKRLGILNLSDFIEAQRIDNYLGLPSYIGKSKVQSFNSNKEWVHQRLNNWKVKFLSQAGNEVLLKAIVQAIPTYSMSVFLLLVYLCRKLQGMMQRFWWGHMVKETNVHWMSYEKMGRSKSIVGLRFRDLIMFNRWRLM